MKNSFKQLLAVLLIGSIYLSFSSCKDSENVTDAPNSPEDITLSKESESARALLSVLNFTSELDSLPDNWNSNSFNVEPTVGVVNDASTPYVRYVPVINKEEAITKYNSFAWKGISEEGTSSTWTIENIGSMTFNVIDQADVIATLDINIKQQPHLTQIRFVPASALGSNGLFSITDEPYYSFGDIISLKEGNNTSYWVCVRPCSKLDDKGKSHWVSFQLNAWDDNKKNKVSSGSINFKRLHDSDYQDYYLPYQLGDSREHLQNFFRLLMVLDAPALQENFIRSGIGTNNPVELNYTKVNMISKLWDKNNYWQKILPEHVTREDLSSIFRKDQTEVNVFYNGCTKTPSVYMATLQGKELNLKNADEKDKDEIKWRRTVAGCDFSDYAKWGIQHDGFNPAFPIKELPKRGFIVRYKTGAKLVGKFGGGNDQDYRHSFMKKHSDIIQDIYVFNKDKEILDKGSSALGDNILDPDGTDEVCVLNNSNSAPQSWNDNSYFFKYRAASHNTENVFLQEKNISSCAYMHLLNALMADYAGRLDIVDKLPKFSSDYSLGLVALNSGLGTLNIEQIVNFKALDNKGLPIEGKKDIANLEKFIITFPFKDKKLEEGYYYTADLVYDIHKGEYEILYNFSPIHIAQNGFLCLKSYKDLGMTEPLLEDGQKFYQTYLLKDRDNTKKEAIDFLKKYAPNLK